MTDIFLSNEFEREVIVLHTTTLVRLFDLNPDATLLYVFYIKNAKIQGTNSVYATDSFCRKGLSWGRDRFNSAKAILKDNGFINLKVLRDSEGKITKHFIRIHYLSSSVPETHVVDEPTCGSQTTNAVNKKGNALDKNINTVITEWNSLKLQKCTKVTRPIVKTIEKSLSIFQLSDILAAIHNYSTVINSDDYWFDYRWSIRDFFSRGLSEKGLEDQKGFLQFLNVAGPLERFHSQSTADVFSKTRTTIPLQTVEYDAKSPLDTLKQTYMGVSLDIIQNRNFREYLIDFKNRADVEFAHYMWLEEGVAGALYHKDEQLLNEYVTEFRRYVKVFKKQAKIYKENL